MTAARGFTLVEAAIGTGIGMLVLSLAAAAFAVGKRALDGIEAAAARTQVLQSAVLWSLARPAMPQAFPAGPMLRQVGTAAWAYTDPAPPAGDERYHVVTLRSFAAAGRDLGVFYLPIIRERP